MKKKTFGVLLFVVFAFQLMGSPVQAQEAEEMGMMGSEKGSKGMMGGKMMGMHMMMKMMMEKSVIATSDGGIVVVAGNKITKYDKDLSVVKEAEVKMDMEAMGKHMQEMMEKCPMMKNMQSKEDSGEQEAAPSGHEGHH